MARVNVEEEAFARIGKLAGYMGVSDREAGGTVLMLWRDSQDVLALEGTHEDVVDWARLYGLDEIAVERWLRALVRARFISPTKDGKYRIHGNEEQIGGRVKRLKKGVKGADATRRKWRLLQAGQKQATTTLEAQQFSSVQFSSDQGSSVQASAGQKGSRGASRAAPDGAVVWGAYSEGYKERYGKEPVRNARANALCAQLVKRLGAEDAPLVAAFYVAHPNPYYQQRGHALTSLVADAEKLHTEWSTGNVIRGGPKTREQIVSEANQEMYRKIDRGEV